METLRRSIWINEAIDECATRKLTANQIVQLAEAVKSPGEPLEQSLTQFIKDGNSYRPVGPITLVDKLNPCPYDVQMTMAGVVFERVKPSMDEVLVFENSALNKVVQEIDRFWDRKANYDQLGLLHNRGILLYGPPGTGKSIALQQVVEMMAKRGDLVLFVKSPEAIIEGMKALRQIEPNRKVVISFEEADEMCRYNERAMLRLMDGDAKVNGVLYLATTNYIDRLPPRMLRPGRFDKKVYVGPPTLENRRVYLEHKLKAIEKPEQIAKLAEQTDGLGFGHLRELIAGVYAIGDSVKDVLERLRQTNDPSEPILSGLTEPCKVDRWIGESDETRRGLKKWYTDKHAKSDMKKSDEEMNVNPKSGLSHAPDCDCNVCEKRRAQRVKRPPHQDMSDPIERSRRSKNVESTAARKLVDILTR
jgi:hypothetical protein